MFNFNSGFKIQVNDKDGFQNPLPYEVNNISTIHSNFSLTISQEQASEND